MKTLKLLSIIIVMIALPSTSQARNILISNDDGLTSNVIALYNVLKAQDHDVIVSVPCSNQSGMGAAIMLEPIMPVESNCRGGAAMRGSLGVGRMSRPDLPEGDFFYVNGTPIMSMLYGLDILSNQRWGKAPDLVLSGPNEGQNVGSLVLSSGTVSNARLAAIKGIPAIALSADMNTVGDGMVASPHSEKVALASANLVAALDRRSDGANMLPAGLLLNVNFPIDLSAAEWIVSSVGTYDHYWIKFAMPTGPEDHKEAEDGGNGSTKPGVAGLIVGVNPEGPGANQMGDEAAVIQHDIALTPIWAGSSSEAVAQSWLASITPGIESLANKSAADPRSGSQSQYLPDHTPTLCPPTLPR